MDSAKKADIQMTDSDDSTISSSSSDTESLSE